MTKIVGDITGLSLRGRAAGERGSNTAGDSRGAGMNYPAPERKGSFELKKYAGGTTTMLANPDSVLMIDGAAPNPLVFTAKRPFVDFEWILDVKANKQCQNTGTIDLQYRELSPVDDRTKPWSDFKAPVRDAQGNISVQGDVITPVISDAVYLLKLKSPAVLKRDHITQDTNHLLGIANNGKIAASGGKIKPVQAYRKQKTSTTFWGRDPLQELSERNFIVVPAHTRVKVTVSGDAKIFIYHVHPLFLVDTIDVRLDKNGKDGKKQYVFPEKHHADAYIHIFEVNFRRPQSTHYIGFGATVFGKSAWLLRMFVVTDMIQIDMFSNGYGALVAGDGGTLMTTQLGGPLYFPIIGGDEEDGQTVVIESIAHPDFGTFYVRIRNNSRFKYAVGWAGDNGLFGGINGPMAIIDAGGIVEVRPPLSSPVKTAKHQLKVYALSLHKLFKAGLSIDSVTSSVDSPPKPVYIYRNLQYVYK